MAARTISLTTPVNQRLAQLEAIALEGARAPSVMAMGRDLCARATVPGWSWLLPLVAVQSLPIRPDPVGVDVYRDAVETLATGGDCANKCALLGAIYTAQRATRCERVLWRLLWEHCGSSCAYDHVRLELRVGGQTWQVDPLQSGVLPGDRAVSWTPRQVIAGRWL